MSLGQTVAQEFLAQSMELHNAIGLYGITYFHRGEFATDPP